VLFVGPQIGCDFYYPQLKLDAPSVVDIRKPSQAGAAYSK
jgi:hypothetical protein